MITKIVLKSLSTIAFVASLTAAGVASAETKVGFVYVGSISDHGWSYQHNQARLGLEKVKGG